MINDENFYKDDIVEGTLDNLENMEIDDTETAVVWAVDTTLRYVIEWLRNTGYAAKADVLETLGEF